MVTRDLRFGVRVLLKNRAFAVAAIGVLALGAGASTAVFSVLRAVLLTPLPYRAPDRVVLFRADLPGYDHQPSLTNTETIALRAQTDIFASVAAIDASPANLTGQDIMDAVPGASPADDFFPTLGVQPLIGRLVRHSDYGQDWVAAVDLSYEAWQRDFHGDPHIVGRTIDVNNHPMTVVGVLPPQFRLYLGPDVPLPPIVDVWFPRVGFDHDPYRGQKVIARLRDGVSLEAAQAAVRTVASRLVAAHPADYKSGALHLSIAPLDREATAEARPALEAIAGAVAFVLLIACANLVNLLLARTTGREREISIRLAIGASRGAIVRQLLVEGLLLGAAAGALATMLAAWAVDLLVAMAPGGLLHRDAIHIDAAVAAFAVGMALTTSLAVSLWPAWTAARQDLSLRMKRENASNRRASVTRGVLVAAQLAMSLVLLVGAGLMIRAFAELRAVPLGFDPHGVVTFGTDLQNLPFNSGTIQEARARRLVFYQQLEDRLRQLPGVEAVGIGMPAPFGHSGTMMQTFSLGPDEPARQSEGVIALAGYLESLRATLVAGRFFTRADDNQPVTIIDERLAARLWPGGSPVGRRLFMQYTVGTPQWDTVVGVVRHVQNQELRSGMPQLWVTYGTRAYTGLDVVVRAAQPLAVVAGARAVVQELGAGRPIHNVHLLDDSVASASADTRFALFVLAVFAVLALLVTAAGIYAVAAYATAQRSREFATRIALGAGRGSILSLALRQIAGWTLVGLAAGTMGSLLVTRYLRALLFHVGERDPLTFAAVAVVLAAVSLLAAAVPARRAAQLDPVGVLKTD